MDSLLNVLITVIASIFCTVLSVVVTLAVAKGTTDVKKGDLQLNQKKVEIEERDGLISSMREIITSYSLRIKDLEDELEKAHKEVDRLRTILEGLEIIRRSPGSTS